MWAGRRVASRRHHIKGHHKGDDDRQLDGVADQAWAFAGHVASGAQVGKARVVVVSHSR